MVQVSIVTESLLQVAALMQRQRRSSELLKFRQVAASKGTIIRTALFDAWNVWLGCWWFRREISRWVFFRSTFHGFVTIFLCWYLITAIRKLQVLIRRYWDTFDIGGLMKSSLKRLDIVYRIVHILEIYFIGRVIWPVIYIYIYIDLSILRVSVALSNKRENNNVIE